MRIAANAAFSISFIAVVINLSVAKIQQQAKSGLSLHPSAPPLEVVIPPAYESLSIDSL